MTTILPFDPGPAGYAVLALVLFASGFVRGYAGFGSSAVIIAALTTIIDPSRLVPVTIMLEVYASLLMAISIWRQIGWQDLKLMATGAVMGSPLGVLSHFVVPVAMLKIVIQTIVLAVSSALLAGLRRQKPVGNHGKAVIGFISGIINGGAGIGGLVIATFFISGPEQPAHIRATLVFYFLIVNITSAVLLAWGGLLTVASVVTLIFVIPIFSIGVWAGSKHFLGASPETFRRLVLSLLIVLALAGLVHTIANLD